MDNEKDFELVRSDNIISLFLLTVMICKLDREQRALFLVGLMRTGIMRLPWYGRLLVNILKFCGLSEKSIWDSFYHGMVRNPNLSNNILQATNDHILSGKDVTSKESVGGLNQVELEVVVDLIKATGFNISDELTDKFYLAQDIPKNQHRKILEEISRSESLDSLKLV